MMIFDNFKDTTDAQAFLSRVRLEYGLDGRVYTDAEAAANDDYYPYALTAPVVLIDRADDEADEEAVELLVGDYSGRFAGT